MSEFEELYPDAHEILGYAAPSARPPARVKDRLFAEVRNARYPGFVEALPGIHILRTADKKWKPTPYEGVTYKTLHVDRATSMATSLLRLAPGSVYPKHRHSATEHCLVVEGTVKTGAVSLGAGDYEIADAESIHSEISTDTGAVLLIISSIHDEMLA